jgi:zinc transport system permease protein
VSEELAEIDGYPVRRLKAMLVLLLALVVAISMKIVGVLLIIPAAAARPLAKSPEQMAIFASVIGMYRCVRVWLLRLFGIPQQGRRLLFLPRVFL